MQIVIDISENIYNLIAKGEESRDFVYKSDLMRAILEGIPLPKGHGKLIDADVLKKSNEEYIIAYPMDEEECMRNTMVRWINDDITDAPTIIEADKRK